ncbi:endonuclease/exonuclease/phosphatase family protein [Frateuria sp. GZRe12]|uniref:exodeoxyribonuclease III n=1 Tax=Frateuria sp. GZRe12 TaxID=3351533 RepID=UPI003EDC541F
MRIVSWNVENLARWLEDDAAGLPALHARLGSPDVLCLQEVRIRPQDQALVARMHSALPGFSCHASLNHDAHNGRFRGGRAYGVSTWLRADLDATPLRFPWDIEGRVIVSGLPSLGIAVANVYAVNGTGRPHWDAERGGPHGDRHQFKQRFIESLGAEARTLQASGLALVLIGDWNVSRSRQDTTPRLRTEEPHATARRRFNEEFVAGLGLTDAFRHLHPDARAYTWFHPRSRHRLDAARVDFALVGEDLLPRLAGAGIEDDPAIRPGSDHAPLWIELS